MINRELGAHLKKLASWYPVVSVTGPRQSGKSTLVQDIFKDHQYINLEDPAMRSRALMDPTGFIDLLDEKTIIDEAQYAPELFSAIQAKADMRRTNGQFILSGSQNFLLLKSIRQSLAGRVGIAYLLPLSFPEIYNAGNCDDVFNIITRGSYPALYSTQVPSDLFYENYLDTYVTRDVLEYLDVRNERDFRRFLVACATRSGNLINYSDLARDIGVSVPTVRSWISILESSFLITTLTPYAKNISKRLTKTSKLYFCDTGLLCHLLGIKDADMLLKSDSRGAVFENFIISEQLKKYRNQLMRPELSFYRDDSKIEVDLVDATDPNCFMLCEVKSGLTYRHNFTKNLYSVSKTLGLDNVSLNVIYAGQGSFKDGDVQVFETRDWLLR